MSPENLAKVRDAEAKAWRSISTYHSLVVETKGENDYALESLLQAIQRGKKEVSKLIDSLPD